MWSRVSELINWLIPPTRATTLLALETSHSVTQHLRPGTVGRCIFLTSYNEVVIKTLITSNKFEGDQNSIALLASIVIKWIQSQNYELPIVIIPIPLSVRRHRARGYNQVAQVATAVAQQLPHIRVHTDLLMRTRDTLPQTSLKRNERITNMKEAFAVTMPEAVTQYNEHHFVILDDVLTTGATMEAARAALTPHLPTTSTLTCVAIAH